MGFKRWSEVVGLFSQKWLINIFTVYATSITENWISLINCVVVAYSEKKNQHTSCEKPLSQAVFIFAFLFALMLMAGLYIFLFTPCFRIIYWLYLIPYFTLCALNRGLLVGLEVDGWVLLSGNLDFN